MSVPTASVGLTPNSRTSSGVIKDPPPIPVMPTRTPTPKPKMMSSGSIGPQLLDGSSSHRVDEDVSDLRTGELDGRALSVDKHLTHRGAGEENLVLRSGRRRLRGRHCAGEVAPEAVLELQRLDTQLAGLELVEDV